MKTELILMDLNELELKIISTRRDYKHIVHSEDFDDAFTDLIKKLAKVRAALIEGALND